MTGLLQVNQVFQVSGLGPGGLVVGVGFTTRSVDFVWGREGGNCLRLSLAGNLFWKLVPVPWL